MYDLDELNGAIAFIEDESNYYSMFRHVINSCVTANTIVLALWNVSQISDIDLHNYRQRINVARQNAIEKHKNFVLRRLMKNDNHTIESVVESVYNDIFY